METQTVPLYITKFKNVEIDENSHYSFDTLDEIVYLTKFFDNLYLLLGDNFDNYIFFLYGRLDSNILPASYHVKNIKKKVLIFLSNENHEIINPNLPGDYFAIFKCYSFQDVYNKRIFAFPLGYVKETEHQKVKNILQRKTKVFFAGNLNQNRISLYKALSGSNIPDLVFKIYLKILKKAPFLPNVIKKDLSDKFPASLLLFTNGYKKGLTGKDYSKLLYDSQIVLCPKGFLVTETFRHYEAMRAGCVVISEKLPDTYLYRNSPIIQVENWQEGINLAHKLINNQPLLEQYHIKMLNWWETVCNEQSTAVYVSNIFNQLEKENK